MNSHGTLVSLLYYENMCSSSSEHIALPKNPWLMQERNSSKNTKNKLFRWFKIIVIVYCLVGIAIYYLQDNLLLHPVELPQNARYSSTMAFREVNIPYDKSTNINIIQFTSKSVRPKGLILYFHGNKNNIKRYEKFVPDLTKCDYDVWMIDYPGFGKSNGKFDEQTVYEWSLIMYKLARKKYVPDSIIIYGKSLGSGIAAQLASIRDCKMLILETPYYSITSLAKTYFWMYPVEWIVRYKIPTFEYLKRVTAPVIIFHGTNDRVIPYSNAIKLKEVMKKADEFVTLKNGTHLNLNTFGEMRRKMDSVLRL